MSGPSATRSGAGSSPPNPIRSPIRSSTQSRGDLFMPSVYPPEEADTIEGLGQRLGISGNKLRETVEAFNAGCRAGDFHPTELDGVATEGVTPPKTNWARPISEPPFYGYSLRPGVTFTYLGLKVDETARVQGRARPARKRLGRGRDHGRLDPRARLSGRLRHDHRHRFRPHRRTGGRSPCRLTPPLSPRPAVRSRSATPAAIAKAIARSFRRCSRSAALPPPTSPNSRTSATTAAAATMPANIPNRMNSP